MGTIQIKCEGADQVSIDKLIPFQGELKRLSDENYEKLKNEIIDLGFSEPISVWKNEGSLNILNGHQRVHTIKKMIEEGFDCPELPINFIEADSIEQAHRKVLALTSQYGEVTEEGLKEEAKRAGYGIVDLQMRLRMPEIDFSKLQKMFQPQDDSKKEDEVPTIPKALYIKLGDRFELGGHVLLCGDSTDPCAIDLLMMDEKADMVLTDPPYGMNAKTVWDKNCVGIHSGGTGGKTYKPIEGDNKDFDPNILLKYFSYCKEIFLFGADYYCWSLPKGGSWIVWDKRTKKDGTPIENILMGVEFELCWSKNKNPRKIARFLHAGLASCENDVRMHPTQKPVQLFSWFFDQWGKNKIKIVDLFGGSGASLIACEKTNRKCFMMEIDPYYCSVILERYLQYSKNEPTRCSDGLTWSQIKEQPPIQS